MACEIKITSVVSTGPAGSTPASIVVTGTATECASVNVTFRCVNPVTLTVAVDQDGNWTAEFLDLVQLEKSGCRCGGGVLVVAVCKDNPNCVARFEGKLECKPVGGCPVVSFKVTLGECNFDATRQITLTATVTAGAATAFVQWEHEGGLAGTAFVVAAGTTVNSPPEIVSYPGGTHVSKLKILAPAGCPDLLVTIDVPPCEIGKCPEVTDLVPKVDGCAGVGNSATVTFVGTLSPPGTGCTFQWDFGDGTPELTTNTPTATHEFTTPNTYAVAVVAIC